MGLFGKIANTVVETATGGHYTLENVTDTDWDGNVLSMNDANDVIKDVSGAMGKIIGGTLADDTGEKIGEKVGRHIADRRKPF